MKAPLLAAMEGLMVPVYIQSFEAEILRELAPMTDFKLVQLYTGDPQAAAAGYEPPLEEASAYADGVGSLQTSAVGRTGPAIRFCHKRTWVWPGSSSLDFPG